MTDPLLQRVLLLLLVAVAAVAGALGIAEAAGGGGGDEDGVLAAAEAPGGGWYRAVAAPYRLDREAGLTACGQPAADTTAGIGHPVLPCGAKLVIRYGDTEVLAQVVDRGSGRAGREFELTAALAATVGLRGVEPIEWRFASRG